MSRPRSRRAALAAAALAATALAAAALAAGAGAAPRAAGLTPVQLAGRVLANGETVYVDASQTRLLGRNSADQIRGKILRTGGDPIYVAVLPGNARTSDWQGVLKELTKLLNPTFTKPQTIAAVIGGRLRATSTAIPYARAMELADTAVEKKQADPLEAKISEFITLVGQEEGKSESGGTGGVITGVVLSLVVFVGGGVLLLRRRRRWRELDRVKPVVEDDLEALRRALRGLPEPEASTVREPVDRASRALRRARGAEHLPGVAAEVAAARRALAVATAELGGDVAPPDGPPCFFDHRHGAAGADVEWTPAPGAAPRIVPACAADAERLAQGQPPAARVVAYGEAVQVPWWEAGPELAAYLAPGERASLAGLPAGRPLRPSRWKP